MCKDSESGILIRDQLTRWTLYLIILNHCLLEHPKIFFFSFHFKTCNCCPKQGTWRPRVLNLVFSANTNILWLLERLGHRASQSVLHVPFYSHSHFPPPPFSPHWSVPRFCNRHFKKCYVIVALAYHLGRRVFFTQSNSLEIQPACRVWLPSLHSAAITSLSSHVPRTQHLACFQRGAIMNKATINTHKEILRRA